MEKSITCTITSVKIQRSSITMKSEIHNWGLKEPGVLQDESWCYLFTLHSATFSVTRPEKKPQVLSNTRLKHKFHGATKITRSGVAATRTKTATAHRGKAATPPPPSSSRSTRPAGPGRCRGRHAACLERGRPEPARPSRQEPCSRRRPARTTPPCPLARPGRGGRGRRGRLPSASVQAEVAAGCPATQERAHVPAGAGGPARARSRSPPPPRRRAVAPSRAARPDGGRRSPAGSGPPSARARAPPEARRGCGHSSPAAATTPPPPAPGRQPRPRAGRPARNRRPPPAPRLPRPRSAGPMGGRRQVCATCTTWGGGGQVGPRPRAEKPAAIARFPGVQPAWERPPPAPGKGGG